jgi:ribokinase
MTARIVVIGSLNMDLVVQAPRHPDPGETLTGTGFHTVPGGKGANQAVAASRMGAHVTMIGCVGADAFGDQMIAALNAAGVDVGRIERVQDATGVALITVSERGDNTIVVVPGANGAVTPEQVRVNEDFIAGADAVLLQLEVPLPAVKTAAEIASHHNVPVILNPAPAQPLGPEILRFVSYLIPNEHEAALLSQREPATIAELGDVAASLRALGAESVIITLGERGAVLWEGDETSRIAAFPIRSLDSTAAGDAFVGAFAVSLSEGMTPKEATLWGCAAGGLACTALGAQPSLPARERVLRLIAGRGGTD